MAHHSILGIEERIVALEAKYAPTESRRQFFTRISKMLVTMCSEFKAYCYEILASLETDEAARQQEVFFDEHIKRLWSLWTVRGTPGSTPARRSL